MAVQSFRANIVAGLNEISGGSTPYATTTKAAIDLANPALNTNRWEMLYSATPANDESLKHLGEHQGFEKEGTERKYFTGRIRSPQGWRRVFNIETQPIAYLGVAYPDWDADDIETLITELVTRPYLWVNFETPRITGSTDYYPVAVTDWQIVHNDNTGTKRVTLKLLHAFPNK